jgi:hypothetical protein
MSPSRSRSGVTFSCSDNLGLPVPAYNLDSLPLGTLVSLITENLPVKGIAANAGGPSSNGKNADGTIPAISKCIGVRTTFQIMTGTCKLWKTRKYFNTCSSQQVLTQVKEHEKVCHASTMAKSSGLTAVALTDDGRYITLTTSNTGANPTNPSVYYQASAAGSVCDGDIVFFPWPYFVDEHFSCKIVPAPSGDPTPACRFTSAQVARPAESWLELFLSWFPGGVTLQPYGSTAGGFEKLVTYHLDIE